MKISKKNGITRILLSLDETVKVAKKLHATGLKDLIWNKQGEFIAELAYQYKSKHGKTFLPEGFITGEVEYEARISLTPESLMLEILPEENSEEEDRECIAAMVDEQRSLLEHYADKLAPYLGSMLPEPDVFESARKPKNLSTSGKGFIFLADSIGNAMDISHFIENGSISKAMEKYYVFSDKFSLYAQEHSRSVKASSYPIGTVLCKIRNGNLKKI